MNKICIVGLGYIGLPTALVLARKHSNVVGFDINPDIVENINKGISHIKEPDVDAELSLAINKNSFYATNEAVAADIYIIAVPTPYLKENEGILHPDTSKVFQAIESISTFFKKESLLIIESTCPVGTTEKAANLISKTVNIQIEELNIAYCPERVIPGNIFNELLNNDRVIGGVNLNSSILARNLYKGFCKGKFFLTNSNTAEMVKLSENAFRDVNIAFANELSMVCDSINVDVNELIKLSNHHPRVNILKPGCGVGGHCIAVDPWFIASQSPDCTPLIQTARSVNLKKTLWVIDKIKKNSFLFKDNNGREPVIGCLGLAFKPNVNDLRESPALQIVEKLISDKYELLISEPNLKEKKGFKLYKYEEVLKNADLVFVLVAHDEFKEINFEDQNIFDYCGLT